MTVDMMNEVPQMEAPKTHRVAENSRVWAFLAYLLLLPGWILVLIFARKDRFAMFHVRQSVALVATVLLAPLVWGVFAYIAALLIPLVGPLVSASTFALVIGVGLVFFVDWVWGMINALRGAERLLPLPGGLGRRIAEGAD